MGDNPRERIEWRVEDWARLALPPETLEALARYVEDGIRTGDFLYFVLCNQFSEAVLRADAVNVHRLREFALVAANCIPATAHGTEQRVKAWIEAGGLNGVAESCGRKAVAAIANVDENAGDVIVNAANSPEGPVVRDGVTHVTLDEISRGSS